MNWILAIAISLLAAALIVARAIEAHTAALRTSVTADPNEGERRLVCDIAAELVAADLASPAYQCELNAAKVRACEAADAETEVVWTMRRSTTDNEKKVAREVSDNMRAQVAQVDALISPLRYVNAAWHIYDLVKDEQRLRNSRYS